MDVDMPFSFIFCLRNINSEFENEKFKKAGYQSIYKFFSGTSIYNESVVGDFSVTPVPIGLGF